MGGAILAGQPVRTEEMIMKWRYRVLIAASLGLCCSVGACPSLWKRAPIAVDPDCPAETQKNTTATGTVGTNGLNPEFYRTHQAMLTAFMKAPLTDPAHPNSLNSVWSALLDDDQSEDATTFASYAIDCAVKTQSKLSYTTRGGKTLNFDAGTGILTDTYAWLSQPLTLPQSANVHRCMATRMNLNPVPVWMEGGDVAVAKSLSCSEYPVSEGFWAATTDGTGGGGTTITWWPPLSFVTAEKASFNSDKASSRAEYAADFLNALTRRACVPPTATSPCPIKAGTGTCKLEANVWRCGPNGVDAIETRLTCDDCCSPAYPIPPHFCDQNGCTCKTSTSTSSRP
jgi:hypothetical protein